MADEELMVFYQKTDVLAFNVLYARYSGRVLGFLMKKCRSDKVAQDLTQEVFLKLHRSKSQYDPKLPFSPWIFTMTRSVFLDTAKKRNLEDVTAPEAFDRIPAVERQTVDNSQEEMLESLPAFQKQAVTLRIYDEATFEDIAARLSTSPENARQLFSRGMKLLKARMTKGGRDE
jgi:RNA polymerase sigma-70 factor (ECF subfamily)